jgi:hypothetical protein
MLSTLVRIAASRWTKLVILLLWFGFLILMLLRGWIWQSSEVIDKGELTEHYNSFSIERTPVFVWLTMILLGYAAHLFKQWSLGSYGLVEVACGLAGGFIAIGKLPLGHAPAWVGLTLSTFIIVRGAGNIAQAVEEKELRTAQ